MRIIKKISAIILVASIIISFNAPLAKADMFDLGNPGAAAQEGMDSIMSSMGANQQETKNMVQSLNVSRQKKTPPQVTLTFTPTNPSPGEQITATATSTYFMNDAKSLYYTWVLKHDYCTDGLITGNSSDKEKSCDLDGNNRVNIEDYKIEAARIIANGGFDWQSALGRDSSNCAGEDQPEYCNSDNQYDTASDDADGYTPYFGGDDQKDRADHCYLHDATSGDEYELPECKHLFPTHEIDSNFGRPNERFWHTDPNSKDTANSGTVDGAAVIGLGKLAFTWSYVPGDKISVAVEGVSVEATAYKDASYKTMWAIPTSSLDTDLGDLPNNTSTETASPTTASITAPITVPVAEYDAGDYGDIIQTVTKVDKTYSAPDYSVKSTGAGKEIMERKVTTVTTETYTATAISDGTNYTITYASSSTSSPVVTPTSPALLPTDPPTFLELQTNTDDLNSKLKDSLVEPSENAQDKKLDITLSYSPEQPVNDFSINADHADTLELQSFILNATDKAFLKYSWQFFLGSDLASADSWPVLTKTELSDQAGLAQSTGIGLQSVKLKLNFKEDFLRSNSVSTTNNLFYLKAILRATESTEKNGRRETAKDGSGTVIIPVHFSNDSKIKAFYTDVNDAASTISLGATERCTADLEKVICPVLKNEIVGVKFEPTGSTDIANYDFLWMLDGKPFPANETHPNTASFPVLEEKGTSYTLSLNVSNKITGEKENLLRTFEIADPKISILTNDQATCAPVLLGNYIDLDNKQWPDYSTDSFEALPGTTVKLRVTANPVALMDKAAWFVNGVAVTANTDGTLEIPIPADALIGEAYTVGIGALYTQPNSVKKLLNARWDVPLTDFYEKQVGSSITIKIADHLSSTPAGTAKVNKQKVLASLFSELPTYVNFLFRIVLTILLILFSTGLLFSIFPKQNQE